MNVVLVGFMASGKTAVGRRVAHRLGYDFFDTDQFIEQQAGCTIADLFEHKGESHFRDLETRLVNNLHELDNCVVSTGGGILTTDGNLETLRKVGLTVFLNADRGEILQRLERDTRRPKLKVGELEKTVNRLLDERLARYSQTDLSINTKGKSVNRVAGEIIHAIGEHGSFGQRAAPTEPLEHTEQGGTAERDAAEDTAVKVTGDIQASQQAAEVGRSAASLQYTDSPEPGRGKAGVISLDDEEQSE